MIKIINNLRYRTETSVTIASRSYTNNGNHVGTTYLEKTPKGNYFKYVTGGRDLHSPEEDISELTKLEAFELAKTLQPFSDEEHRHVSEEFGDLITEA